MTRSYEEACEAGYDGMSPSEERRWRNRNKGHEDCRDPDHRGCETCMDVETKDDDEPNTIEVSDDQIDALLESLDDVSQTYGTWCFGLPLHATEAKEELVAAVRNWLNKLEDL